MKALSILKELKKGYSIHKNDVDDAIEELEALQNRSCKGCKHFSLEYMSNESSVGICQYITCPKVDYLIDADFCCNKFEPKDK